MRLNIFRPLSAKNRFLWEWKGWAFRFVKFFRNC